MPKIDIQIIPGMDRELPGHLLHQEGTSYARVLNNLRPRYGELERRPGLVEFFSGDKPTRDGLAGTYPVVHIEELNIQPGIQDRWLVITTREIFIYQRTSGWHDVTPTYTDGTVDVTNGSTSVSGTGTSWASLAVRGSGSPVGDWFKGPDGNWYNIASVASDTSLTLSTAYGGSTLSGQSYIIKRTPYFHPDYSSNPLVPHIARINQDLYIGGPVASGSLDSSGTIPDGGVLKVTDAYSLWKTSFSPSDVEFILSGKTAVESGVDNPGEFMQIYGMGVLADGRLVVVAQAHSDTTNLTSGARIYYSSHLDTSVWTISPGGATDINDYDGAVTGVSFSTINVAVHFDNGIEVAELTGQDDPPLRFRPSRASNVGAIGPRMIARVPQGGATPGTEIFLGSDRNFYAWNGTNVVPLSAKGMAREVDDAGNEIGPLSYETIREGFSLVNTRSNEVAFYFPGTTTTREIRYDYVTGSLWRGTYARPLYCGYVLEKEQIDAEYDVVFGTDNDSSWFWQTDRSVTSDSDSGAGDTGGIYAIFEGLGLSPEEEFCIQEIIVFCRAPFYATPAATTWSLTWYGEHKASGETVTASVTPVRIAREKDAIRPEYAAIFIGFSNVPVREFSFVLSSSNDNSLAANISRIQVHVSAPTADVRAT